MRGRYYVNWNAVHRTSAGEEPGHNSIVLLRAIATVMLTILTFFGIRSAVQIVLHEQRKNLQSQTYTSVTKLYRESIGKAYHRANRTGGVLILLMIAVMSFGTYAVQLFV